MKNQYFGDVNDYRKYGLLRCFIDAGFSLGVCWMLTADDGGRDGQKISYLEGAGPWRDYDPALFDLLAHTLTKQGARRVDCIEKSGLLPNTRFVSDVLQDSALQRERYVSSVKCSLAGSDLVFFDPDNGIEVRSVLYGAKRSAQYLYWNEIESMWHEGASLLIYQHYPRERRTNFVARLLKELRRRTSSPLIASASTANVVFLFVGQFEHSSRFEKASTLISQRWAGQISLSSSESA